ncbi:hypothetical protein [Dickeya ananatis]|uniref:hypothetical protein n=1 Tax=Dickeya ananatis TaxID=3061286 RepID=UPI00388CFAD6
MRISLFGCVYFPLWHSSEVLHCTRITLPEYSVVLTKFTTDFYVLFMGKTLWGKSLSGDTTEEKTMPVEIQENEVKTATAAEGIHYPALSSCMSITCILSNGSKVGAHAFQFGDYGITLINRMKALVGNNAVVAVKAKGHGGCWGKALESQAELAPIAVQQWKNANPTIARDPTTLELTPYLQPLFITADPVVFTHWLNAQFNIQNATFTDMDDDGDVDVDANGNFF